MNEFDGADRTRPGSVRTLSAYARLVRLPNLFTAPPDVLLGAALLAGLGYAVSVRTVAGLALASMSLYAAGTTLNDYFDADEDARERPERPIPAGDVPRRHALGVGIALLGVGVALALVAGGPAAGGIAGFLAALIVLYDGVAKGAPIGFLFMGGARATNVLLGTTAATVPTALPAWSLSIPVVVLAYVGAVTFMAEGETGTSSRLAVTVAMAAVAVAAAGVVGVLVVRSPPAVGTALSVVLLVGFVAWTGRALWAARRNPAPGTIGPAVGTCVLGLVVLDAAFAATTGVAWSLATVSFLVPAVGLAEIYDVS